jgi:hypothetical protein
VLELENGDLMSGRIDSLSETVLGYTVDVSTGTPLSIPVSRIVSILRSGAETATPSAKLDALEFNEGGIIYGSFISFDGTNIGFDADAIGRMVIPATVIRSIRKAGNEYRDRSSPDTGFEVRTRSGSVIAGKLEPDGADAFTVRGEDALTKLAAKSIAMIHFPSPPVPVAPAPGQAAKARIAISAMLSNGSELNGFEGSMSSGKLSLAFSGGQRVSVPLANVNALHFYEIGSLSKSVLVWGAYGDSEEELPNTIAAITSSLGKTWKIDSVDESELNAAFKAKLGKAGVLLIPEWENWSDEGDEDFDATLKSLLAQFLAKGGKIVVLAPTDDQCSYFATIGIFPFTAVSSGDPEEIAITKDGKRWSSGISGSIGATNATTSYEFEDGPKPTVIASADDYAVAFMSKVSKGSVYVFGPDFYETNDQMTRLLANLISQ